MTFSGIFSNFLSFVIPLIIMGFIIPGIASLGNKSGKTLAITTILAYVSTIIAGLIAFTAGRVLLPKFISGSDNLIGKGVDVIPYFTINMPPIMEVMSALVLAFLLGIGISKIKNSSLLKVSEEFKAVGTQSSAATIPVTLLSTAKNNVSEEVRDFVIPLCATIHLAGDTITLVLTSMGVMYMNGLAPTIGSYFPFILMLGITMVAAPGVPGGGVMASLGILESMLGFGAIEKSIMIALHVAQDSFGTATNITGDGALAIIVDEIVKKEK